MVPSPYVAFRNPARFERPASVAPGFLSPVILDHGCWWLVAGCWQPQTAQRQPAAGRNDQQPV